MYLTGFAPPLIPTIFGASSKLHEARVSGELNEGAIYRASSLLPGLNGEGKFAHILHLGGLTGDDSETIIGYVDIDDCEVKTEE
ncbi:hypothetical protein MYX76_02450 [Desulfobacterota bacterium AH_259_B03_O07]|nr:hypothetical protein [Desulfobacterota bacterium AH_259_B03_O07]